MANLTLPSDFERWPEYITASLISSASEATNALLRLWVDLAYELEATGRLGFLRHAGYERMVGSPSPRPSPQGEGGVASPFCGAAEAFLERVDGGWICPRFVRCNPHLDPSPHKLPFHMKGASVKNFNLEMRKVSANAQQLSLRISPGKWRKPEPNGVPGVTVPMTSEETKHVTILVHSLDRALGRQERSPSDDDWPDTLIADAFQVLAKFSPDRIEAVCRKILLSRGHPALPPTTEQVLPKFGEVAGLIVNRE